MGTIHHTAVIATTYDDERFEAAKAWLAERVKDDQREIVVTCPALMNGYRTIAILPDGSKEWWATSDAAEELRREFIDFLKGGAFKDGSNAWDWCFVGFGELGQSIESNHPEAS